MTQKLQWQQQFCHHHYCCRLSCDNMVCFTQKVFRRYRFISTMPFLSQDCHHNVMMGRGGLMKLDIPQTTDECFSSSSSFPPFLEVFALRRCYSYSLYSHHLGGYMKQYIDLLFTLDSSKWKNMMRFVTKKLDISILIISVLLY